MSLPGILGLLMTVSSFVPPVRSSAWCQVLIGDQGYLRGIISPYELLTRPDPHHEYFNKRISHYSLSPRRVRADESLLQTAAVYLAALALSEQHTSGFLQQQPQPHTARQPKYEEDVLASSDELRIKAPEVEAAAKPTRTKNVAAYEALSRSQQSGIAAELATRLEQDFGGFQPRASSSSRRVQ